MKKQKIILTKRRLKHMRRDRKIRRLFPPADWKYVVNEMTKHRVGGITRRDIDRDIEKSLKKAGDPISHRQAKHFKKIMFNYFDTLEAETRAKPAKRSVPEPELTPKHKVTDELRAQRREETARATFVAAQETHNPANLSGTRSLLPHRDRDTRAAAPPAAATSRSPFATPKQRLDSLRRSPIPPRRVAPSRFNSAPPPTLRPTTFSHFRPSAR